jgi:hypothetical protein
MGRSSAVQAGFDKDIEDEYEPARPNDYEHYCRERLAKRKASIAKVDLERQLKEREMREKKVRQDREWKAPNQSIISDTTTPFAHLSKKGPGGAATSVGVGAGFGGGVGGGGGTWVCECNFSNRPQNDVCGGGNAKFGCGKARDIERTAAVHGRAAMAAAGGGGAGKREGARKGH